MTCTHVHSPCHALHTSVCTGVAAYYSQDGESPDVCCDKPRNSWGCFFMVRALYSFTAVPTTASASMTARNALYPATNLCVPVGSATCNPRKTLTAASSRTAAPSSLQPTRFHCERKVQRHHGFPWGLHRVLGGSVNHLFGSEVGKVGGQVSDLAHRMRHKGFRTKSVHTS